nr:MAG TPA: Cell wall assembly regulator [Caudoviricetes sp.]
MFFKNQVKKSWQKIEEWLNRWNSQEYIIF